MQTLLLAKGVLSGQYLINCSGFCFCRAVFWSMSWLWLDSISRGAEGRVAKMNGRHFCCELTN